MTKGIEMTKSERTEEESEDPLVWKEGDTNKMLGQYEPKMKGWIQ